MLPGSAGALLFIGRFLELVKTLDINEVRFRDVMARGDAPEAGGAAG
jgi:hypothetical protein